MIAEFYNWVCNVFKISFLIIFDFLQTLSAGFLFGSGLILSILFFLPIFEIKTTDLANLNSLPRITEIVN